MKDVLGTWIGGRRGPAHIKSLVLCTMAASSGWGWLSLCCTLKHHRIPSLCLRPGPCLGQRRQQTLSEGKQGSHWLGKWTAEDLSHR